jgi:tRNA modification GTPase
VQRSQRLNELLTAVEREAAQGRKLTDGLSVALAGRPNAGKSSLLNCLAGAEAAIVTAVPGTTRDTIRETVNLGGIALTLIDMAGLRESEDLVENEGIRRAENEIANADYVLWVADVADGIEAAQTDARRAVAAGKPFALVLNKIDRIGGVPRQFDDAGPVLALSARTGQGVDELRAHLGAVAGAAEGEAGGFSARRRHLDALAHARQHVAAAAPLLENGLELAADELRAAQSCLDELTGEHTSDDLLGEIFSTFCIGK